MAKTCLVLVPGNGARVLPLELVPVSGNGAQFCTQAPTKRSVQTGARALSQAPRLRQFCD